MTPNALDRVVRKCLRRRAVGQCRIHEDLGGRAAPGSVVSSELRWRDRRRGRSAANRRGRGPPYRDAFAGWTGDGKAIHVSRYAGKLQIYRIDLVSGSRKLWKEALLLDTAGAQEPYAVIVARDAEAWAAGYQSLLGELYLVEGLK